MKTQLCNHNEFDVFLYIFGYFWFYTFMGVGLIIILMARKEITDYILSLFNLFTYTPTKDYFIQEAGYKTTKIIGKIYHAKKIKL